MRHKSVRDLIMDCALSLGDDIQFGYGRQSDFNQIPDKRYPYIWLAPLSASPNFAQGVYNYQKTWTCVMLFFDLDKADSNNVESAAILDFTDDFVDRFINTLNERIAQGPDVVVQSMSQSSVFKDATDVVTGWLLTFQLVVPDDFDYCAIETLEEDEHC